MIRAARVLALFGLCVLLAAWEDPAREALALHGRWQVIRMRAGGRELPVGRGRVLIFGDGVFHAVQDGRPVGALAYAVDPTARPRHIDLARPGSDRLALGLYARFGDRLVICYAEPGRERPTTFVSERGDTAIILVLERLPDEPTAGR